MRSATRGSRQVRLAPLAWHTATLSSRLDPVFFSQHAHSPYNAIWDHRATEQPRTNQQKIQTGTVGRERTRDGASAAAAPAGARGEPIAPAPPVERVVVVRNALGDFGFETEQYGVHGVAQRNRSFSPRPRIIFTSRSQSIQHDRGSHSTRTAAQKSAENTDCSCRLRQVRTSGRFEHGRSARERPWRSHDASAAGAQAAAAAPWRVLSMVVWQVRWVESKNNRAIKNKRK